MLNRFLIALAALVGTAVLVLPPAHAAKANQEVSEEAGEAVTFETSDGVLLHGRVFSPAKRVKVQGAIVFLHEPFRSSRDWLYMADRLARKGFHGLTFDLRGHGQSLMRGDEELDREIFMEADWADLRLDLAAAVDFLKERTGVSVEQFHLAGADLGGSLALQHAVKREAVASVALLSPGLGYDGLNILGLGKDWKGPLLLVLSIEDGYSRKSAQVLAEEAADPRMVHVEIYYGVGHGAKMLTREPGIESLLIRWFLGTLLVNREERPAEALLKPASSEKNAAGDIDKEAEKKRLAEQRKAAETSGEEAVEEDDEPKRWQEPN